MAQFIQAGDLIDYTPPSAVAAGDVVVQGDLVGIAKRDIPASTPGTLAVSGVFDFPKATGNGTAISAGATVYWDAADKVAKTDDESGANPRLGRTTVAATDAAETVRVRLTP